jgi:hypothetical protein
VRKVHVVAGGVFFVATLVGCGSEPKVTETSSAVLFRTLPGDCGDSPLTVASARASAEENNHFHASFAIDGDDSTRWSSGPASTAWLVLDLGHREMIRGLSIDWERAFSPSFWVQASDDAVSWATLDIDGATQAGVQGIGALDATARYLRILSQKPSSFGNVSIFEAQVSGNPDPACLTKPFVCGGPVLLVPTRAQASSTQFSYTPASAAVDGVYSTRWSSNFTDNEWLAVDLGSVARIDNVRITWEHAFAKRYALQTAASFNGPWTTAVTIDDGAFGTTVSPSIGVNARYLRMLGRERATQYGYSIWEMDVYGSNQTTCP